MKNLNFEKIKIIRLRDKWNPLKYHIFKMYKCGHVYYNQAIVRALGELPKTFFLKRFERCTKTHGYRDILNRYLVNGLYK
jgi:hypothetical protein